MGNLLRVPLAGVAALSLVVILFIASSGSRSAVAAQAASAPSQPSCPHVTYADVVAGRIHPSLLRAVPRVIPCDGVIIGYTATPLMNADAVLLPVGSVPPGILTPAQVLAKAQATGDISGPAPKGTYLVLADFTAPGSIPTDPNEKIPGSDTPIIWHTIEDHLAWIVIEPFAQPVNVSLGLAPAYATASITALDARDASFLFGFFTDAPIR